MFSLFSLLTACGPTSDPNAMRIVGRHTVADDGTIQFAWPGVYAEGRFRGTAIGIDFGNELTISGEPKLPEHQQAIFYDVLVDGQHVRTLENPQGLIWISRLSVGEHRLRVQKRNESAATLSQLRGIRAGHLGALLPPAPAKPSRFIFIGDSYTAGYGLLSNKRDCSDAELAKYSHAGKGFAALTAAHFDADYQINAFSGRGLVRNYDGLMAPTMYDLLDRTSPWPQAQSLLQDQPITAVVVGLGINDFSTPVKTTEVLSRERLYDQFVERYTLLVGKLREIYGKNAWVVLSSTAVGEGRLAEAVNQVAKRLKATGETKLLQWHYEGLKLDGCHWHPSLADHEIMAEGLISILTTKLAAP